MMTGPFARDDRSGPFARAYLDAFLRPRLPARPHVCARCEPWHAAHVRSSGGRGRSLPTGTQMRSTSSRPSSPKEIDRFLPGAGEKTASPS